MGQVGYDISPMKTQELEQLKIWFRQYVSGFYTGGEDKYLDGHYDLKEQHTYLVCEITRRIAEQVGLNEDDVNLAEATGLLHDTGRFEQFRKYRTFKDPESENHCLLGLRILRDEGVLESLAADDRDIIEKAVEFHGVRELPDNLDERALLFCKLIRDADKTDIYRVLAENFKQYYANPKVFPLEVEFADEPRYSPAVVNCLRKRETIAYDTLETLLDAKLLTLGWIFDVNFPSALEMIKQDGHWDALMSFVPDIGDLPEIKAMMQAYIDEAIEKK